MSTIRVHCIDQTLTLVNTPLIASGGIREDDVAFTFCPQWDGFYKTAVFWRDPTASYSVVLDENNSCVVPHEVLTDEGVFFFGVFGVNADEVQRTSEVIRYTVALGPITEGTQPPDPTPEIYTQLLAAIAAMGDNTGKADKVDSATAGNFASLTENGNLQDSGKKAADFLAADRLGAAGGVASLGEDGKVPSGQLPALDYVPTKQKGAAGGVATLGEDKKVPTEQLPAMDYVPIEQKGQAGGVASLDEDGKVPAAQLPEVEDGSGWTVLAKEFSSTQKTLIASSARTVTLATPIPIPETGILEFSFEVFGLNGEMSSGGSLFLRTSAGATQGVLRTAKVSNSEDYTRSTCLISGADETFLTSVVTVSTATATALGIANTNAITNYVWDPGSVLTSYGYILKYRILEG